MERIRRGLTFANVVSALALFLAMSGGAYALSVGKNTVRSAQVANGSLRSADVKNNSLDSTDIDDGSLTAPAARVTFDSTQNKSVPDTVSTNGTTVTWNQELFDTQGLHSGSSPNLTAPIPGIYVVSATVELDNELNVENLRDTAYWLWLQTNGETVVAQTQIPTGEGREFTWSPLDLNVSTLVSLDKGDSVSAGVYQYSGSGTALPLTGGDQHSSFQMAWVGAQDGAPAAAATPFAGKPSEPTQRQKD